MDKNQNWPKETRYLAFIGLLISLIGIVWYFRGIINPLIVAAIFAYVLHPIVDYLATRTRMSYTLSVFLVYLFSILLFGGILATLTPVLVNQIRVIEVDLESLLVNYEELTTTPVTIFGATIFPGQFLPHLPTASIDLLTPLMDNLFAIVEAVTKNFIWIMVVMVCLYYFLLDGSKVQMGFIRIAPEEFRSDINHLYEQLRHVWSDYLRSQLVFMFVVGSLDSIVWLAIGLPGAIILGLLTGITSFVHEIGAVVSGVLSVLAAFFGGSSFLPISNFWFTVLVFILYMVLTGIKNIWLRPVIVGRHVHLHAGIVFVVVLAALIYHGPLAAFLVVPVLVSLLVVGRYLRRRILGLPPFPTGQDPSSYFPASKSEKKQEGEPKQ